MITLYGIPNCDTVKKARTWLQTQGAPHAFHDFKKQGVPKELLAQWQSQLGWESLLNKKGTTWRQLPPDVQASAVDSDAVLALLAAHPSAIKRPVVVWPTGVTVGFDPDQWTARLP
jgi:arsenate reductase (glutaredoxin)